ncbi:hypothetical protein PIB30_014819 [Stylosanthes scabra]|uniref:F-box associated domain-containing protein n=1 Tax=Stylosanthes scabra TaxID=79078 RepID=A0ABU6Q7I9_9FABA|nr:hypothetical protein [Stylosanthes scabra]
MVVPRSLLGYYNHVVVGSDHGVICIRSFVGERNSTILLWNPLIEREQLIPDDTHGHCCFSTSVFSFGYLEDSMEHSIVHIFKCNHTTKRFRWSLYDSWGKGWNNRGFIDSTIERLGPKSVGQKGYVHWLGWGGVQQLQPTHVAIFDMENMTWFDTLIPERAKTTYHSLIDFNDGVGFILYQNVWVNRSIQVWQLVQQGRDGLNWVKMINVRGLGIPLCPSVFIGKDIISVLECSGGFAVGNDTHRTELWITMLKYKTTQVEQLLHNSWQEELCVNQ